MKSALFKRKTISIEVNFLLGEKVHFEFNQFDFFVYFPQKILMVGGKQKRAALPKLVAERSGTKSSEVEKIGNSAVFMETVTKKRFNAFNRSCDSLDRLTPSSENHSKFIQPIRKGKLLNIQLFEEKV